MEGDFIFCILLGFRVRRAIEFDGGIKTEMLVIFFYCIHSSKTRKNQIKLNNN